MSKKECKMSDCAKKTSIGGQALIEGIMMRGPKKSAMAVRDPEGQIVLEKWDIKEPKRARFLKLPVVRGMFNFIDAMTMGYKCLMRSAEIAGLEDSAKPQEDESAAQTEPADVENTEKNKGKKKSAGESVIFGAIMTVASVIGVALSVLLFIMLPSYLYKWCASAMPFIVPESEVTASFVKSVFEGLLKVIILVSYMALVSLMKDIKRTFMYHGAEHKTIFCYENGLELTVENVKKQRRFHPRCGSSFLVLMLIVGMFISFLIDPLFLAILGKIPPTYVRVIVKLLLLPLIMGIGYELIKIAGRHQNVVTRIISAPGMWLQHITVLEPDDDMIECAILAFKEVIPEDDSDKY